MVLGISFEISSDSISYEYPSNVRKDTMELVRHPRISKFTGANIIDFEEYQSDLLSNRTNGMSRFLLP